MPLRPRGVVKRACDRCRRQKLKCDDARPCTLCTRAKKQCIDSRTTSDWQAYEPGSGKSVPIPESSTKRRRVETEEGNAVAQHGSPKSSATLALIEDTLSQESPVPSVSPASALPGGHSVHSAPRSSVAIAETGAIWQLRAALPNGEAINLLVNTYFDRAHWFLLAFHQQPFRATAEVLKDEGACIRLAPDEMFVSLARLLAVLLIGLHHLGDVRSRMLANMGIDAVILRQTISSALKITFLDVVSQTRLEAVQTCVLLGTWYLFHGEPSTAWPIIGAGVRVAQALKLHRESAKDADRAEVETRRRCWWALYEIETFCAMSYGYPSGILDTECDVAPLTAPNESDPTSASSTQAPEQASQLLAYKAHMVGISRIIKRILSTQYTGLHSTNNLDHRADTVTQLSSWSSELPDYLRTEGALVENTGYGSLNEADQDVGASGPAFNTYLLRLQGLSLKLAYENARILLYRTSLPSTGSSSVSNCGHTLPVGDIVTARAIQECREAALETSHLGKLPIFELATNSYAVAFIGMHLLTAGVVLGVVAGYDLFDEHVHATKAGLRDLMMIQRKLVHKSFSAKQCLDILEKLTRSLLDAELRAILSADSNPQGSNGAHIGDAAGSEGLTGVDDGNAGNVDVGTNLPAGDQLFDDASWLTEALDQQEQGWMWNMDWMDQI